MRRLAFIAFCLFFVCAWCLGCSSFATQTGKDFLNKDTNEDLPKITNNEK